MEIRTAVRGRSHRTAVMMASLIFVVVVGMILSFPATGRAGTYFDEPASYPVLAPLGSSAMIAGDFQSDAYPDLAFIAPSRYTSYSSGYGYNGGNGIFALKFNDQFGAFPADDVVRSFPSTYLSVTDALSLDINGDGQTELAWSNASGFVCWFSGPNFSSPTPVRVGPRLEAIAAADFNADTYVDLITIDFTGKLYLLANSAGSGYRRFQPIRPLCNSYDTLEVGDNPNSLAAADFNGDGLIDLAGAISGSQRSQPGIFVLMNNETCPGTAFDAIEPVFETVVPQKLIAADFDADGFPDLAISDAATSDLYILFNESAGMIWDISAPLDCGGRVGALTATDLNDDGRPELICADADSQKLVLFFYDKQAQQFERFEEVSPIGADPKALVAADFNGDDKVDLVSANAGDNTLSVLLNRYEPVVDLSELVEIGVVSTRKAYRLTPVEIGTPVYIDRPYAILDMSEGLQDGLLLQSANNDKWIRSDRHLQLLVRGEAVMMVCYDSRARRLPNWLKDGGWTQTMEWIRSSDYRAGSMQVFMKTVTGSMAHPAELWLGGNHAGGDTRSRSNYYLIIQPKGFQPALPPVKINWVSTGKSYQVARLEKGGRVYCDRSYRLIDHPDVMNDGIIVKTANNDKWVRDSRHLELGMNGDATVFACYDRRAWRLPAWLTDGSWTPTDLKLYTTDRRAGPMTVMMRQVAQGENLVLGGNHEGGYTRARSNYLVIVQTRTVDIEPIEPPLVQVTGCRPFGTDVAQRGGLVYLDRKYEIEKISAGLQGGILVTTANNDKWHRGSRYMKLQAREDVTVYVCYDKRKRWLPRWLANNDWHTTAESIATSDRRAGPMPVYMRSLAAGETLTLGGNHQGGDNRARSNYFLVIQPGS